MPDEIKPDNAPETEVSANTTGPVITTENRSTEVLDNNGKTMEHDTPLSRIFGEIESGTAAKDAIDKEMNKGAASPEKPVDTAEQKTDVVIEKPKDKKEVKTETPPPAPVEEPTEEELRVLPHDKPKTAQRIQALLKKLDETKNSEATTRKQIEEKEAKLKELSEQLDKTSKSSPFEHEEVKKAVEELNMFRRRYQLESSPEIKQKFDDRIVNAEQTIQSNLAKLGVPTDIVKVIQEEGGWLKFSDSQRKLKFADGKTATAADTADIIRQNLPVSERRMLDALELEQTQTARDKTTFFNEESKRANEYFKQVEENNKKAAEEHKRRFEEANKVVGDWRKKLQDDNEWLRQKPLPTNATAEQKTAVEQHNEYAKQLSGLIDKHLAAKDINQMLEVLNDAVRYHQERRNVALAQNQVADLQKKLKESEEKLEQYKRAGSAVRKGGSIAAPARTVSADDKPKVQSLEDAFATIEAGKSLDN